MVGDGKNGLAVQSSRQAVATSSSPDLMYLGTVAPSQIDIENLAAARRTKVRQLAAMQPEDEQGTFLQKHDVLTFKEYREAVKNADKWRRELRRTHETTGELGLRDVTLTNALFAFLQKGYDEESFPPTLLGWAQYLANVTPSFADQIARLHRAAEFPEAVRQTHTLITAASGWGKSELLKTLVYHYVANPAAAVIVLDPHGDMAPQIAQWPDFRDNDRLVYVQPGLAPGMTVGINPLDARGLDEDAIALFADQFGRAIGELSSDLTGNMSMIARGCARLLLEDGEATLFDLLDLIDNPPGRGDDGPLTETQRNRKRLIAKGRQHPDRIMRRFFEGRIEAASLKSARDGIDNRISGLLFLPRFQHMVCGKPSTPPLHRLINERKVIVFNLAPLGVAGATAFGRLIVGLIAGIGHRREGTPLDSRVPCHLFVDEAQTIASTSFASILFELRKFGIHLTLAQQVEGVGFDEVGQKALANSTGTKFVGAKSKAALKPVFGDAEPPTEGMEPFHFWMRWGQHGTPTLVRVQSDFAGTPSEPPGYRITPQEWEAVKADQLARYYRPAMAVADGLPALIEADKRDKKPDQPPPRKPLI